MVTLSGHSPQAADYRPASEQLPEKLVCDRAVCLSDSVNELRLVLPIFHYVACLYQMCILGFRVARL